jgi:mannosyl-oligosaccharide alpha-1,2-mannosidase
LGGSLALGAYNGLSDTHMELAKNLTKTCSEMYFQMPTGLSPEIVYFNTVPGGKEDIIVKVWRFYYSLFPTNISIYMYYYLEFFPFVRL